MRILLRRCAWLLESLHPWRLAPGPLDVLVVNGIVARLGPGIGVEGVDRVVDCRGELGAAPCFYDALYVRSRGGSTWVDELLEDVPEATEEDLERLARLGYCRGLAYARGGRLERRGVVLETPRLIVKPSGEVLEAGGERLVVAATGVSRRSVYGLRSRKGVFAVEYLEKLGLMRSELVVIGPWVSSWEFERIRSVGARVVYSPWLSGLYRGGAPPAPQHIDALVAGSGGVAEAWELFESLALLNSTCYWGRAGLQEAAKIIASSIGLLGGSPVLREGVKADIQVVETKWIPEGVDPLALLSARPRVAQLITRGSLVEPGVV